MIKELPTRDATGREKRTNKHMTYFFYEHRNFTTTECYTERNLFMGKLKLLKHSAQTV